MAYVGRVDDHFVFTRNNDVVTWNKVDRFQKIETNLDHLDDAAIYNDAILISGDGDEISYIDDGVLHQLYDGYLTDTDTYITIPIDEFYPYDNVIAWVHTADSNSIVVNPDWTIDV